MVKEASLNSVDIILKSRIGRSLTENGIAITSENIEEFWPKQEIIMRHYTLVKVEDFNVNYRASKSKIEYYGG
jgi:hypothetical protein